MRHTQYILSARSVTDLVTQSLLTALAWSTASVEPRLLVQLLVRAASQMRSLAAVVAGSTLDHSLETIRRTLHSLLPHDPEAFLPTAARLLHERLPPSIRTQPHLMAVDVHLRPYYGHKTSHTYRGRHKAGTRTFFAYATLMVLAPGQSYTVGLTPVVQGQDYTLTLERLLSQARDAGLTVKCLLLDRGFYGAKVFTWLQTRSIGFIMPMIRRGRAARRTDESTGTQRFFVKGRRGWTTHSWKVPSCRNGGQGALTVTIDVCMTSVASRTRKRKKQLAYACHGQAEADPQVIVETYRRRFGIETSYRQLGEGLAATCSRHATYRLLLVAIALMLRNEWVWLHAERLSETTPDGERRLHLKRLRLRTLLAWIVTILDSRLRVRMIVVSPGQQLNNE